MRLVSDAHYLLPCGGMEGDGFQGASVVGAERARGVVEHYTEVCRAGLVYARREESVVAYAAYFLCGEQTLEEV